MSPPTSSAHGKRTGSVKKTRPAFTIVIWCSLFFSLVAYRCLSRGQSRVSCRRALCMFGWLGFALPEPRLRPKAHWTSVPSTTGLGARKRSRLALKPCRLGLLVGRTPFQRVNAAAAAAAAAVPYALTTPSTLYAGAHCSIPRTY